MVDGRKWTSEIHSGVEEMTQKIRNKQKEAKYEGF